MIHRPKCSAFSLVELSIVLVILGLLVGGILVGQSLIRASELRAIGTEYQRYMTATHAFRDKYFAIPGDMTNATSIWGALNSTASVCIYIPSTGLPTCDGDGNGGLARAGGGAYESFRYWQHLSNAGLIEGQYDGVTHGSTDFSATAANSPKSKMPGLYWAAWGGPGQTYNGYAQYFNGNYGNYFIVGTLVANTYPSGASMRPEELWNIDTKVDDGKPGRGTIVPFGTITTCTNATSGSSLNADYALGMTTADCTLIFRKLF